MTEQAKRPDPTTAGEPASRFGGEPTVREMLADPVVQAVMAVDNVRPDEVMLLLSAARERLGERS